MSPQQDWATAISNMHRSLVSIRDVVPKTNTHTHTETDTLITILRSPIGSGVKAVQFATTCQTATGTHMPHTITQHYLPPGRGNRKKVKVAYTLLLSAGFWSWSRFLVQVMWVLNPAVGCRYFPPGLQLTLQPLGGLLPILLLGEQRHNGCKQFA